MLGVCLVLGFASGIAALAGFLLAGAPLWLAILAYSLAGSLVTGAAAWVGYWLGQPRRKRPAAHAVGALVALQPVRVRR